MPSWGTYSQLCFSTTNVSRIVQENMLYGKKQHTHKKQLKVKTVQCVVEELTQNFTFQQLKVSSIVHKWRNFSELDIKERKREKKSQQLKVGSMVQRSYLKIHGKSLATESEKLRAQLRKLLTASWTNFDIWKGAVQCIGDTELLRASPQNCNWWLMKLTA